MVLNSTIRVSVVLALGLLLATIIATQLKPATRSTEAIQGPETQDASYELDASFDEYEQMLRDEEIARSKDPQWRASHVEIGTFKVGEGASVTNFCINVDGNLLVCNGGDRNEFVFDEKTGEAATKLVKAPAEIRVFSPDGRRLKTWALQTTAQAICVDPSGAVYVCGMGQVAQLDQTGATVRTAAIPGLRGADVSGIAVTERDVFVVAQSPTDFGFVVTRFDRALRDPKQVLSGLSGCCGQMDIQSNRGELWVAHNGRHRVERYSRDGKLLSGFGESDRKAAGGFGGCCEPKNIRFAPDGTILAAESGPPSVVKRFDASGKFLGIVALPNIQTGCVRTTVEVSSDGSRYYVINSDEGTMHVIGRKG